VFNDDNFCAAGRLTLGLFHGTLWFVKKFDLRTFWTGVAGALSSVLFAAKQIITCLESQLRLLLTEDAGEALDGSTKVGAALQEAMQKQSKMWADKLRSLLRYLQLFEEFKCS